MLISSFRLVDLHPTWIDGSCASTAKGIEFDCPSCLAAQRDHSQPYILGHRVEVWFIESPGRTHWGRSGVTFEDLSISPSISGTGPDSTCRFQGSVSCGSVTW